MLTGDIMRFIRQSPPPKAIRKWIETYGGKAEELHYDSGGFPVKEVRESLLREQGHLCAYTMRPIDQNNSHIEHIVPREVAKKTGQLHLETDYANMLACCRQTDGNSSYFVGAEYKANNAVRICNPHKQGEVQGAFSFKLSGKVEGMTTLAKTTIEVLNLNAPFLVDERKESLIALLGTPRKPISVAQAQRHLQRLRHPEDPCHLEAFCVAKEQVLDLFIRKEERRSSVRRAVNQEEKTRR